MEARDLLRIAMLAAAVPLAAMCMLAQARATAAEALAPPGSRRSLRLQREGWYVKQLETARPNVQALSNDAARPDDSWMPATMPAQVHDVLLAHGKVPDPRVGKNAAQSAWVGERDWAYACTFDSPPGDGPAFLRSLM